MPIACNFVNLSFNIMIYSFNIKTSLCSYLGIKVSCKAVKDLFLP